MNALKKIRELLEHPGMLRTIGVYDALSARMAEQAKFEAVWVSGNSLAAGLLGLPDLGLVSFGEVLDQVRRIVRAVEIPVLVDADNGYGNPLNVIRTVREMEASGVAGVSIEDQVSPKRCGHLPGARPVVSREEALQKIRAAVYARSNPDFLIIGRTDAVKEHGLDEAIERANIFLQAGADMVAVEGAEGVEDLKRLSRELQGPCKLQIDAVHAKSGLSFRELEKMGFKLANHAGLLRLTVITAIQKVLQELRETGDGAAILERLVKAEIFHEVVEFPYWRELEERFVRG